MLFYIFSFYFSKSIDLFIINSLFISNYNQLIINLDITKIWILHKLIQLNINLLSLIHLSIQKIKEDSISEIIIKRNKIFLFLFLNFNLIIIIMDIKFIRILNYSNLLFYKIF